MAGVPPSRSSSPSVTRLAADFPLAFSAYSIQTIGLYFLPRLSGLIQPLCSLVVVFACVSSGSHGHGHIVF